MIDFTKSKYSRKAKQFLSKPVEDMPFFTLLDGSVRSGKTTNIIYKIPQLFHEIGNNHLKIFSGYSKQTVKSNVLAELKPYIENYHRGKFKYNSQSGELDITLYGKLYNCLVVGGANANSDAQIQGCTADFAFANELTKHHYSFFNMLSTRLSAPGAKFLADTNPDSTNHWLYTEKIKPYLEDDQNALSTMSYWTFTMDDNLNLAKSYVETQKKLYTGAFYDRKILGQWRVCDGLVYDSFSESRHVLSRADILHKIQKNDFMDYVIGLDYGYNHFTAAVLIGVDRNFNYYIIDEFYQNHVDSEDIIAWVKEKHKEYNRFFRFINADNSRPEQSHKIRQALDITVYEDKPGVVDSISLVRSIINYDRLYVGEDCVNTLNELLTYRYPSSEELYKISPEKRDHPLKESDDAMDALRYILYLYETRFAKIIR